MKKIFFKIVFISLLTTSYSLLTAQVVNQPLHSDIYQYLSRLSQRGVIELHDEIRPLSRKYIAEKLVEISDRRSQITEMEIEELEFYAKDFGREIRQGKRQKAKIAM